MIKDKQLRPLHAARRFNMEIIYFALVYSFHFDAALETLITGPFSGISAFFFFSSGQLVSFLSKQRAEVYLSLSE